jgi:uncharacterized repeat protein (TIGR03803 family)
MTRTQSAKFTCMAALLCLTGVIVAQAQTFTTIANLPVSLLPLTLLVQGEDGNLLGEGTGINVFAAGAILRINLNGQLTPLYHFCSQSNCSDGEFPEGLFQASDGKIYGTTQLGGAGNGVLYRLSTGNKEIVVHRFCSQPDCTDGANPSSAPVPSLKGGLLGTTAAGGANGQGTLFEVSPTGDLTTLFSFCAQSDCTDGADPVTPPIQTANGIIFGTTTYGGKYSAGTVYALTTREHLVTIHSFQPVEPGSVAPTALIQGADGNFYGLTFNGGSVTNDGTIFRVTPLGKFTNLYSFCPKTNCLDGTGPSSLIQGSDGNLYGITNQGGANNSGTIFKVSRDGSLTTLYTFCQQPKCPDGGGPVSLMQETNGMFYGTTERGGSLGGGTVFSLSLGLGPFVQMNPGFGKAGAKIALLGNNLTGTTNVMFNGTEAAFTVVSGSYIIATVPNGATSGTIEVTVPGGVLASNLPFEILP